MKPYVAPEIEIIPLKGDADILTGPSDTQMPEEGN